MGVIGIRVLRTLRSRTAKAQAALRSEGRGGRGGEGRGEGLSERGLALPSTRKPVSYRHGVRWLAAEGLAPQALPHPGRYKLRIRFGQNSTGAMCFARYSAVGVGSGLRLRPWRAQLDVGLAKAEATARVMASGRIARARSRAQPNDMVFVDLSTNDKSTVNVGATNQPINE